jgi:hypothetical protein
MPLISTVPSPASFALFPADMFANPIRIDWERTEELYRDAYAIVREAQRPTIVDRLAPYWN